MIFFRQGYKSVLWSQLLLGMVAIFALPTLSQYDSEAPQNSIQQTLTLSDLVNYQSIDDEQAHFLFQLDSFLYKTAKQAVTFCQFLTNPYYLEEISIPPIRAGPVV